MKIFFDNKRKYCINGFESNWDLDSESKIIAYNENKKIGIECWQSKDRKQREYYFVIDINERQSATDAITENVLKINDKGDILLSFSMHEFAKGLKQDKESIQLFNELKDLDIPAEKMLDELNKTIPIAGWGNKNKQYAVYSCLQRQKYTLSKQAQEALSKIDKFVAKQRSSEADYDEENMDEENSASNNMSHKNIKYGSSYLGKDKINNQKGGKKGV